MAAAATQYLSLSYESLLWYQLAASLWWCMVSKSVVGNLGRIKKLHVHTHLFLRFVAAKSRGLTTAESRGQTTLPAADLQRLTRQTLNE